MKKDDWLMVLAGFNLLGFLTLPFYYGSQLTVTNPLLWFFVPDCQLAALFISVAIIINHKWLSDWAFGVAFKYGVWTVAVMTIFMNYYLTPTNAIEYWIIVVTHLVLAIEAFILMNKLSFGKSAIPVIIFLALNDFSDYVLSTHPPLPAYGVEFVSVLTPLISLTSVSLIWFLSLKKKIN